MTEKPNSEESRLRNLRRALGEADRLASELDIPENVRTKGTSLYRQVRREGKLPGRSVEEVVASTLYLACRENEIPRSPDDFASHSEYDRTKILRAAAFVEEVMDLNIPPASPRMYVEKFGNELDLNKTTIKQAKDLIKSVENEGVLSGVSPTGGAAGAIYAAGRITGEKPTQGNISEVADVSEVTIRNRYQEILDEGTFVDQGGDE